LPQIPGIFKLHLTYLIFEVAISRASYKVIISIPVINNK
jgi:hypothetical protein